jgi:hypothetical protein
VCTQTCYVSRDEKNVQHAIEVFETYSIGNYHRFFQLYLSAELMGGYLMDLYVLRERKRVSP